MPICYICLNDFHHISGLMLHLKYKHKVSGVSGVYKCRESGCLRDFLGENSFRKHFRHKHNNLKPYNETLHNSTGNYIATQKIDCSEHPSIQSGNNATLSDPSDVDLDLFQSNVELECSSFIAKLYSRSDMSRSQVQNTVTMVIDLFSSFLSPIQSDIYNCTVTNDATKESLLVKLGVLQNAFKNMSTDYLRMNHLVKNNYLIKPIEYVIGTRLENKSVAGEIIITPIESKGHFIPLRLLFAQIFSLPQFLEKNLENIQKLSNCQGVISNFIQGTLWQSKVKSFGENYVLPLVIYFDEFETCNPLGSRAGIHKLGAVYISFPSIPPQFSSVLENIFLVLLFHSSDKTMFGNHAVFNILIKELNFLEEEGISLSSLEEGKKLFFSLGVITGDNLGLHSILGFSESFSSHYPCRFCKMPRKELQFSVSARPELLRTKLNYDEDVSRESLSDTGIKENCIFNKVHSYHVTDNASVDIMHDIFEGVCNFDLSRLLKHYIYEKKLFTIDNLNDRIQTLNVSDNEKGSRSPVITLDNLKKCSFNMSASQMIFFVRFLGLAIGDIVPEGDEFWYLYIILRQIVGLVMAPSFQPGCEILVDTLVKEHHETYIKLFREPLKPKHHFMTHYSKIMLLSGPLVHLWSMRFEARHKSFKTASNITTSRKNITLTLSMKNQLQLVERILSQRGLNDNYVTLGPGELIEITEAEFYYEIKNSLPDQFHGSTWVPTWVSVKGTTYKHGMIVVSGINDDMPIFCFVVCILADDKNSVSFICKELKTVLFDSHFYAYEVERRSTYACVQYHDLIDFNPTFMISSNTGRLLVPVRNEL